MQVKEALSHSTKTESTVILKLLCLKEVETIVGLKKSKIYSLIKSGLFPQPLRLGNKTSRWNSTSISSWKKLNSANSSPTDNHTTQVDLSTNALSTGAIKLTTIKPPDESPSESLRFSHIIHICAWYTGYIAKAFDGSRHRLLNANHKRITENAHKATNALAEVKEAVHAGYYRKDRHLNATLRPHALFRQPRKTNPAMLSTVLVRKVTEAAEATRKDSDFTAHSSMEQALLHLVALDKEMSEILSLTGWMPQWPSRIKSTKTIKAQHE